MSSLGSLTAWIQSHITAIHTAASEPALQFALDSFFSPNASIHYNGKYVSSDDTRARLSQSPVLHTQKVAIQWQNSVEVPDEPNADAPTGLVGRFYVLTYTSKLRLRAGPMQTLESVAFNAKVEHDPSVEPNENYDRRRVTFLYETAATSRPPLHLHSVVQPPEDKQSTT